MTVVEIAVGLVLAVGLAVAAARVCGSGVTTVADHDPLCQWANTPTHRDRATCPRCTLIARVRADEWKRTRDEVAHQIRGERAHAEAVAAKLVEVICLDDMVLRQMEHDWRRVNHTADRYLADRDAARAEVVRLETAWKVEAQRANEQVDAARAEVAAAGTRGFQQCLDLCGSKGEPECGKRVRADLRAKVEGLPPVTIHGLGVAHGPLLLASDVLALIDGAQ